MVPKQPHHRPRLPRSLPVLPLRTHIAHPCDLFLGEAEADTDVIEPLDIHVDNFLNGDRTILQEREGRWKPRQLTWGENTVGSRTSRPRTVLNPIPHISTIRFRIAGDTFPSSILFFSSCLLTKASSDSFMPISLIMNSLSC